MLAAVSVMTSVRGDRRLWMAMERVASRNGPTERYSVCCWDVGERCVDAWTKSWKFLGGVGVFDGGCGRV